jgi:hypothetical protein
MLITIGSNRAKLCLVQCRKKILVTREIDRKYNYDYFIQVNIVLVYQANLISSKQTMDDTFLFFYLSSFIYISIDWRVFYVYYLQKECDDLMSKSKYVFGNGSFCSV